MRVGDEKRIKQAVERLLAAKTPAEAREARRELATAVGRVLSDGASIRAQHQWQRTFEAATRSLWEEMFGDAKLAASKRELCGLKEAYLSALAGTLLGLSTAATEVEGKE